MASQHRELYSYLDAEGNRKSIRLNGRDKSETDEKFQRFILMGKQAPTLLEFVDTVYRPVFINGLADTTKANYEIFLALYILPFMGDKPMNEIKVDEIQRFYDWMATAGSHGHRKNLNRATIQRVGGLASRIFRVAVEKEIIRSNPFKTTLLSNRGEPATHHKPLSDSEVDRIKRAIPTIEDERQRLYMGLLAYTGMRREEIMGLCWECIDLEQGFGKVKRVVVYPKNSVPIVKETPKTEASERVFIIPQPLKELLEPCAKQSGFVIHGRKPEEPASMSTMKRNYVEAFRAMGIQGRYNNHDWRTTFGAQLKDAGLTSAQGADLMGHADTRMFETVYARARDEGILKHRETIEKLNQPYACGT